MPVQSGYVGFAADIQVNPAVQADPVAGARRQHAIAGSPTGAGAFTPNPAGGPAGFTTLIDRVLNYTLRRRRAGRGAAAGVQHHRPRRLRHAERTLCRARDAGRTRRRRWSRRRRRTAPPRPASSRTEQAVQTTLNNKLATESGVNMDTEMSLMIQLQNAMARTPR